MTTASALMGLCGIGVAAGLLLIAYGLRRRPDRPVAKRSWRRRPRLPAHPVRRTVGAVVAAAAFLALTRWPAGALLAAGAAFALPSLLGPDRAERLGTKQVEAIAGWAEMLRDTLAAAAGLEQTIIATAGTAPEPVRPAIRRLADRLEDGERLPVALRRLADDLANPVADLILAALVLASERQGRQLAPLLGELASSARAQAEMRRRVAASRAKVHATVRVVVGTTLAFAALLVVFNRPFLTPYDSATGQGMLLAVGAIFAVAFVWLRRQYRLEDPERFLTELAPPRPTPAADTPQDEEARP